MTATELKALQSSAGLSNQDAADTLSVSLRAVKYWRSGQRKISPAMAELIKIKMGRKK